MFRENLFPERLLARLSVVQAEFISIEEVALDKRRQTFFDARPLVKNLETVRTQLFTVNTMMRNA